MMDLNLILNTLRETCAPQMSVRILPLGETVVELEPDQLRPAVEVLVSQFALRHLSTITGDDVGGKIVLLYHFWDGVGLTLRVSLPPEQAIVPTVIDLISGAVFYEREATEMLDVMFEWHPMSVRLFLPDDWHGDAPLRKQVEDG
ncbi:MAG: NADH-quinone oxidoreductase subunit C [Anaerolineae bacterium]|nr:NADH-quinone oxidoreductase subunit C [Anaerolineae bacterium]